ncbi:hypothetical protein ILUMI_24768 [Ignelater luminosus]|uniref:HTH psq-type domain-containing protein n=1 Tax=Ignelater luminosus TaxID=2038154 RepID=A0A8K0C6J5_IGNLU|nr:hypothetical protein ILUMI_24768 [Ignelater luminosus]
MTKTKKRESSRKFFSYTEKNLQKAIEAITKNGVSRKSAAREFNVPRSTLVRNLSLATPPRRKMGRAAELSEIEEEMIENWSQTASSKKLLLLLDQLKNKIEQRDPEEFLKTYLDEEDWSGDVSCLKLYNVWAVIKTDTESLQKHIEISEANSTRETDKNINSSEKNKPPTNIYNSPVAGPSRCTEWNTPPQRSICYYGKKENKGLKVPTPFKNEVNKKRMQKPTEQTLIKTTAAGEESCSESDMDVTCDDEDLDLSEPENLTLITGQYVIVKYEDNYYPGIILKYDSEGAEVRTMVNAGINPWKWPLKEGILYYFKDAIICIIQKPQPKNNRGHYTVSEMKKYN